MDESVIGLFKTELHRNPAALVRNGGPWRGLDDLEIATCGWVAWFNEERFHGELDDYTPRTSRTPTTVTGLSPTRHEKPTHRVSGEPRPIQGDVDMVIVPALDRFARNVRDDANLFFELHQAGVELISVKENIDHTPSGMLLHWVMAAVNEFESRNNGLRTISGMAQKAKVGGTPGRAPIGYRNIITTVNGRQVRDVEIDPERGPPVRWAFEAYASGDWTIRELTDELNRKGLKALPQGNQPEKPIHFSRVANLLGNRYYVGVVSFKGVEYPGRHEPLVDEELFARVQTVRDARQGSGEKQRVHHHYLKGAIYCLHCGSRLCVAKAKRRYDYFFCVGRQRRNGCRLPYLSMDAVEAALEVHYRSVSLDPELAAEAKDALAAELADRRYHSQLDVTRQRKRLARLADERRKLLQAFYAGAIPLELLTEEQARITSEVQQAQSLLTQAEHAFEDVEATIRAALELAVNLHDAYQRGGPQVRRLLNQFFFKRVLVGSGDVQVELSEPVEALYRYALTRAKTPKTQRRRMATAARCLARSRGVRARVPMLTAWYPSHDVTRTHAARVRAFPMTTA